MVALLTNDSATFERHQAVIRRDELPRAPSVDVVGAILSPEITTWSWRFDRACEASQRGGQSIRWAVMMGPWTRRGSGQPSTATVSTSPGVFDRTTGARSSSPTLIASSLDWRHPPTTSARPGPPPTGAAIRSRSVLHTHNVQTARRGGYGHSSIPRFLDVAEAILGPDIVLHHTKLFQKPRGAGSPFPVHQDWRYFPTSDDQMIAAIIHVTSATAEMGCVSAFPGSHRLGRLPSNVRTIEVR